MNVNTVKDKMITVKQERTPQNKFHVCNIKTFTWDPVRKITHLCPHCVCNGFCVQSHETCGEAWK